VRMGSRVKSLRGERAYSREPVKANVLSSNAEDMCRKDEAGCRLHLGISGGCWLDQAS
jgi:hypothetical protein